MQDLTLNEEDKKHFICNIKPDYETEEKYKILYASGKEVTSSIRTYDEYMIKMEHQFVNYKEEFKKAKYNELYINKILKSLTEMALIMESFLLFYNINKVDLNNILIIILVLLTTIFAFAKINKNNKKLKDKIGNIIATEYYLSNKNVFVKKAYDEKNNVKYSYNIVDMNNIGLFNSKTELLKYKEIIDFEETIKLVRSD